MASNSDAIQIRGGQRACIIDFLPSVESAQCKADTVCLYGLFRPCPPAGRNNPCAARKTGRPYQTPLPLE